MKQVVAALAVFAALLVLVVVLMRDGDDEAATAPKDAETVATVGEEGGGADVADEPDRDASGDDGMAGDAAGMTVGESAGTDDADDAAVPPDFDIVRVEPSGEAVMAGVAEPGAEVSVMTRDGVVAQTGADDRGEWVVVLEEPLEPGDHEIWLEAGNGNGEIVESAGAVVISIPEEGEDLDDDTVETIAVDGAGNEEAADPMETAEAGGDARDETVGSAESGMADSTGAGAADSTGSEAATAGEAVEPESEPAEDAGAIAVVVPRDGGNGVVVMQAPGDGVGISGGGDLTLESLSYDEDGNVSLSGRAAPGGAVIPYIDGALSGEAVADAEGRWRLTLESPLEAGQYDLRIDQIDETGAVVARLETPFQRAALTMPTVDEPLVVIQPGNNLWVIARRVYGRGVLYTQIFEANRGQIADPDLIYPGQIFVVPGAGPPEG